ncbi:MAG: GNAT family N-acetyltransferase [Streptococcaceae bacterium]|jgi:predicted GNAT family N-acyltransferase|nr:GNAT family N-acetyltransferase [Streptococcaceae bacterium]
MKIVSTRDTMSEIYLESLKIRNRVFGDEEKVPHDVEMDKFEAYSVHFVGINEENRPIATVRFLPDDASKTGLMRRLSVLPEFRHHHIASQLIEELVDFAKKNGFVKVEVHSQIHAIGLYEEHQFKQTSEVFEEIGIPHIRMERLI